MPKVVGSADPACAVRIRCSPNKIREFYSRLSPRRKEIVDNCMFSSFFKCRQAAMSGFLIEYLLECYRGKGIFLLNDKEVMFGRRDVALISGLSVTSSAMRETSVQVPSFRERFFPGIKHVSYQDINQAVFGERYIGRINPGDEGVSLSDVDFRRMVYLFVLATVLFPNSYYNVDHKHLSFVDDLNFEAYSWGVDVHEEILRELDRCKAKVDELRRQGESKGKLVYMQGCALILHYFVLEHIPGSGVDLVSVASPRMLRWEALPFYKSLRAAQKAFSGAAKEVIVLLHPNADEEHLLVGLKEEGTQKKTPSKTPPRIPKKPTVEVSEEKVVVPEPVPSSESSSEYDDVFDVNLSAPSPSKTVRKKVKEGVSVMGVRTVLMAIMERLARMETKIDGLEAKVDRLDSKVDRVEERLSLVEESCAAVRATVDRAELTKFEEARKDKEHKRYPMRSKPSTDYSLLWPTFPRRSGRGLMWLPQRP